MQSKNTCIVRIAVIVLAAALVVLSCAKAAAELDTKALMAVLAKRETAKAEDMMRAAVVAAQKHFDEMYK
jgi:xylose isomerase